MDVKKRIAAFSAALALFFTGVQTPLFADGEFTVCNTSFEDNEIVFAANGGKTEYVADDVKSGERAVRVSDYSDKESVPRISLSDVNREARSEISVWVKPEIADADAKLSLLLFTRDEADRQRLCKLSFGRFENNFRYGACGS